MGNQAAGLCLEIFNLAFPFASQVGAQTDHMTTLCCLPINETIIVSFTTNKTPSQPCIHPPTMTTQLWLKTLHPYLSDRLKGNLVFGISGRVIGPGQWLITTATACQCVQCYFCPLVGKMFGCFFKHPCPSWVPAILTPVFCEVLELAASQRATSCPNTPPEPNKCSRRFPFAPPRALNM